MSELLEVGLCRRARGRVGCAELAALQGIHTGIWGENHLLFHSERWGGGGSTDETTAGVCASRVLWEVTAGCPNFWGFQFSGSVRSLVRESQPFPRENQEIFMC